MPGGFQPHTATQGHMTPCDSLCQTTSTGPVQILSQLFASSTSKTDYPLTILRVEGDSDTGGTVTMTGSGPDAGSDFVIEPSALVPGGLTGRVLDVRTDDVTSWSRSHQCHRWTTSSRATRSTYGMCRSRTSRRSRPGALASTCRRSAQSNRSPCSISSAKALARSSRWSGLRRGPEGRLG